MENLRENIVEIIAGAIPEHEDTTKFCESDGFTVMIDKIMQTIHDKIES